MGKPDPRGWRVCNTLWPVLFLSVGILAAAVEPTPAETDPSNRETVLPGLEWIRWEGGELCRSGDSGIEVLVADPERFRFQNFHYVREGETSPLSMTEWHDRTHAIALFNAGQYYPDYSYMGLLIVDGRPVRSRLHRSFQGLFVAEPTDSQAPKARILDLLWDRFDAAQPGYLQVAQSFMLLDRTGAVRVQRTDNVANRTVLAEGHDRRIWVFVTRGGYTLWEFGQLLKASPFQILQAMCMDGGEESQMLVSAPGFHYDSVAPPQPGEAPARTASPWIRRPLPTVIGVFPRDGR